MIPRYEGIEGFLGLSKEQRDFVLANEFPEPVTHLESTMNMMAIVDTCMALMRTLSSMDGHTKQSTEDMRICFERIKRLQKVLIVNSGIPEDQKQDFLNDLVEEEHSDD